MSDFYFDLSGDIKISPNKDIAITQTRSQSDVQQIYIRLMTDPGDFYSYPKLGCDLSMLYGMPQTKQTGEIGKRIIQQSLAREGIFGDRRITIDAVPTSRNSIRFDVHIENNGIEPVTISVTQDLS
jgi:hypothetical protein